jgi:glycosyltransferase involved in cell wall biosynthesis
MADCSQGKRRRICLITSAHISYNPRLVKEADALTEAGYDVRVVSVNVEPKKWQLDRGLMASRTWQLTPLCINRRLWLLAGIRQKALAHSSIFWVGDWDALAFSRYCRQLAKLALSRQEDLFIAHNLEALPAAFHAARSQGAKLGFDAEDYHRGEFDESPRTEWQRVLVARIEQKYMPQCDYVSAASPGIAETYAQLLDVRTPRVILNAFPLCERSGLTPASELAQERKGDGISLYWYSHVIGPGRGLTDVVEALGIIRGNIHLHLRGERIEGFHDELFGLARRSGVDNFIHVLSPVPPEQLVERSAQHDIGLALEMGHTPNRKIAITNKILNYMLAGLGIAATDVPAQRDIVAASPGAGFLYAPGDAQALAKGLNVWLKDPAALKRAKTAARHWAEARFCWDREKTKLLDGIGELFKSRDA